MGLQMALMHILYKLQITKADTTCILKLGTAKPTRACFMPEPRSTQKQNHGKIEGAPLLNGSHTYLLVMQHSLPPWPPG